jgi:hypothetical protein
MGMRLSSMKMAKCADTKKMAGKWSNLMVKIYSKISKDSTSERTSKANGRLMTQLTASPSK